LNRKALSLAVLGLLLGSLLTAIPIVKASSHSFTEDIYYTSTSPNYSTLDNKYVKLSDGRGVYGWVDYSTNSYIRLKVLNSTGGVDGEANFQRNAQYYFSDCSLYYVNDTSVLVFYVMTYLQTTIRYVEGVLNFNPTSLNVANYDETTNVDLGASTAFISACYISTVITYNSKYYAMVNLRNWYYNGLYGVRTDLVEYTGTASTATNFYSSSSSASYDTSPIWWFYEGSGLAYALYRTPAHDAGVYKVSLAAKTLTYLASDPDPTYLPNYLNAQFSHFLRGDIETHGTDLYLYFSYVMSTTSGSLQIIRVKQVRYIFDTTIAEANLSSTDNIKYLTTLNLNSLGSPVWVVGTSPSKSLLYIWFADLIGGVTELYRIRSELVGDWFSTSINFTNQVTEPATESVPLIDPTTYPLSIDFSTGWGMGRDLTNTIVYYNLVTLGAGTYTVTANLTPVDNPYETNKAYTLAVQGYQGGGARGGLAFWLTVNTQPPALYGMSGTGYRALTLTFTQAGNATILVQLVDARINTNSVVASVSHSYNVVTGTGGTNPSNPSNTTIPFLSGTGVTMLVNFLPTFIVVVGPAIMFIPFGGAGMVVGLGVGVLLGTLSGIIPFYVTFILLLLIAIGLVMVFRSGISTTNQGAG